MVPWPAPPPGAPRPPVARLDAGCGARSHACPHPRRAAAASPATVDVLLGRVAGTRRRAAPSALAHARPAFGRAAAPRLPPPQRDERWRTRDGSAGLGQRRRGRPPFGPGAHRYASAPRTGSARRPAVTDGGAPTRPGAWLASRLPTVSSPGWRYGDVLRRRRDHDGARPYPEDRAAGGMVGTSPPRSGPTLGGGLEAARRRSALGPTPRASLPSSRAPFT